MKITSRKGFIKQFSGPGDNEIVCFRFWQAVIASGCPGECSYCFLQTQHPYRSGAYDVKGTLFHNLRELGPEAAAWLRNTKGPAALIVGENQDGLAFEKPYKRLLGVSPLEILVPLFETEKTNPRGHLLVVLSKFVSSGYAEAFGPQRNVVYSWSLSLPEISRRYERSVSPLALRVSKADSMRKAGYRVRFRLDALAPVVNWRAELLSVVGMINQVRPEMLTVGALRATNVGALRGAARANGRDASIFDHISSSDPSGFKDRTALEFQREAFTLVRENLSAGIALGLCKEDASLWESSGYTWGGCHCLKGSDDAVTGPRLHVIGGLK